MKHNKLSCFTKGR